MGFFKKLLMTLWFLAALLGTAALVLTIYGPWTREALALFALDSYSYAVQGCVAFALVGGFVMWVRVLSRRKKAQTIELSDGEGGQISITRDAIASQARYIVETDGSCEAAKVAVFAEKHGLVSVDVTIRPHYTVSAVEKGAELKEELREGLTRLCGDRLGNISLEFLAPEEPSALQDAEPASCLAEAEGFSDGDGASAESGEAPVEEIQSGPADGVLDGAGKERELPASAEPADAPAGASVAHPDPSGDGVTIPMMGAARREEEAHE